MSGGQARAGGDDGRCGDGAAPFDVIHPDRDEAAFATAYAAYGVCIIRKLIDTNRLIALDEEARRLHRAVETGEIPDTHMTKRPSVTGEEIFERIDPVCEISSVMQTVAADLSIRRYAGRAVGARPTLLKDKLIYKFPGDAGYDLHQDYPYFYDSELMAGAVATVMIAIDPMVPGNGCLGVYSRYHERQLTPPPGRPRDVARDAVSARRRHDVDLEPGDGVFFHALTPHESGPNLSGSTRRALFLTYMAEGPGGAREAYYRHRRGLGQGRLFR